MGRYGREDSIKSIIRMEDRIVQCGRCPALVSCTPKPSLGRGDMEPQVLLVFECECVFTRNMDWIIQLRNSVKQHFAVERIYHTFLVRCQPKACTSNQGIDCSLPSRLLDRNNICVLTNQICGGILIKPTDEEILNCMPYLLEEIMALQPAYVMLFGHRVSDFVLKSFGRIEPDLDTTVYRYEDTTFLVTAAAETIQDAEVQRLAGWHMGSGGVLNPDKNRLK